ncbi:MAG: YdcF family protein [Ignavibacteriaceae bacterium]|nr:MAG: YdcF family protein [Ignavibacteriaceae bacterium]MBV6445115.1 hypothetical protein [Ignavibacteriaceae bacterium]MBW7872498.1 YdcF family protein [Ignavibacteria bacterium]MBZ0197620.1 YdcF family protein [Ignavibacteriaceae bacterium]WKZ73782.1 MAG: YdcF family protein [Ignavibacteriaceae bacterium]
MLSANAQKKILLSKIRLKGIFDLFVLVLLGAIDFLTQTLGKYLNHRLDFEAFSFSYRGNLFYLIFSGLMIVLFIIFWLKDKDEFTNKRMLMLTFWFLGFVFSVSGIYLNQSSTGPTVSLLDTPFDKLYTGIFFNIGFAFKTILVAYLIMKIISGKRFVVLGSVSLFILAYATMFVYTYSYISSGMTTKLTYSRKNPADVAVILGAAVWKYNRPSSIFRMRIEKGLQLYATGAAKKLQLTGSNAPGELPEADVAFYYLLNKKINPGDIRLEAESRSTLDQISYIKTELIGKTGYQKIIIVSDAFHLTRVKEMAQFYNLSLDYVKSDITLTDDSLRWYLFREVVGLINFWMFAVK